MRKHIRNSFLLFYLIANFLGFPAWGYELEAHDRLSIRAFANSMLRHNNDQFLKSLNLEVTDLFLNSKNELHDVATLIADGARFEDDGSRPTKHFFNPLTGSGIDPFKSSPEFMLTDFLGEGQRGGGANPYTYPDAVDYFYRAMTLNTKTERDGNWGRLSEHESYTNSRGKIT